MAHKVYEAGCSVGNANACLNLGITYVKGQGVQQSNEKAKHYFLKSCKRGNTKGCNYAKRVLITKQDK